MENNLQNTRNFIEFISDTFNSGSKLLRSKKNDVFDADREKAFQTFIKLGLPEKKNEKYKYTNLAPVFNHPYKISIEEPSIAFQVDDIFRCDVPELETELVILLNGFYYHQGNPIKQLENGIIIGSLLKATEKYPDLIKKHIFQITDETDSLVALNKAFAMDGIFVYIPKNKKMEKPLQIINMAMSDADLMVQHRNLFILEENSKAEIIICDHTLSPHRFLTNQFLEVSVGNHAKLAVTRVQNEHLGASQITHSYIVQEEKSKVSYTNITLHGGLVRNNIHVKLNGEEAENSTQGLYLLDKGQHIDNFVFIDHAHPLCTSNQLFKGVLDDFSTGAFNGKILVQKDAQKTMAYQANNNILLTDDAKMSTRPQLEIYADDVKCSHGATIGQLDENAMFYLQSRGINAKEARLLLMNGFTHDVIKKIEVEPLRERISELVEKRLRGELSRCNNCQMHCGEC